MMDQPEFTREFSVERRTDRDVELPILFEFFDSLNRHGWCPLSMIDLGAAYTADTYLPLILPHCLDYTGIDLREDVEVMKLMNGKTSRYLIENFNQVRINLQRDLVICLSTIEHVGISPSAQGDILEEQRIAFERCLELSRRAAFISFPVGLARVIPGELSIIAEGLLSKWEHRLIPYRWSERFFYTEGAQAGKPWREHLDRAFATTRPYVDTVGTQSLCVLEVYK